MKQLQITKAVRQKRKARICLAGPSGSGKTMTALRVARGLVGDEGTILLLDTERGSATLYADACEFDHADLPDFDYETYISGIKQAGEAGYDCVVVDSVSHAWQEFLDQHNKMQGNSYANWGKITPKYNQLIQAIVSYPGHIIVTMRAKTKYEMDEKGRPVRNYIGTIMRDGTEYEFDVVGMIDIQHNMAIEKTRLQFLADKIVTKPGEDFGKEIREWLDGGASPAKKLDPKPAKRMPTEEECLAMGWAYTFPRDIPKSEKKTMMEMVYDAGGAFVQGVAYTPIPLEEFDQFLCTKDETEARAV